MDSHTFRILSLCSGVGGIELGFKLAVPSARTIGYIENEAFACSILEARMQDKTLDEAPIWTDLKTFDGKPWRGKVDCLTGGYPCQPFSVAGRKLGEKDPRHLWPEIKRLIGEIEPPICFFENVGGHLRLGFEQVANDLQELGYKVKAGLFTAQEVGAPHKRERLFILAYRDSIRSSIQSNGNIGKLEKEIRSEEKTRNQSSQATKDCCSGIRELANCCVIGCECGSYNFCKRYLQDQQIRDSKKNQQKWQGRVTGISQNCQDVADSEKFVCQRAMPKRDQEQQSESEIRGGSSELANTKSDGAGKHEFGIWQGIKKHSHKLANSKCLGWRRGSDGMEGRQSSKIEVKRSLCSCSEIMGNANNEGLERWQCQQSNQNQLPSWPPSPTSYEQWEGIPNNLKPAIYKLADGMANRVDEIRASGNGVVPLVAAYAWRVLSDGMCLVKDQRK
ncbi:DNA cytosine methyltransferase [Rickettsiales bacterium]|nr:DNA cytosine methyltransferase [Rickettsiales bacterium]